MGARVWVNTVTPRWFRSTTKIPPASASPLRSTTPNRPWALPIRSAICTQIPATIAIFVAPLYLFSSDPLWITVGFGLQGAFGGALYSQLPSYLSERFPTEVRATASAFCYHQGAILGGLVAPVLAYFAINYNLGYAVPMAVGTIVAAVSVVVALSLSPETKGQELVADLVTV